MKMRILGLALSVLVGITAGTVPGLAENANAPTKATSADAKAVELLTQMSKFYAGLPSFSYSLAATQSMKLPKTIESETTNYEMKIYKPLNLAVDASRGQNPDKKLGRLNETEIAIYIPKKGYIKQKAGDVPAEARLPAAVALLTARQVALFGLLDSICSKDPLDNMTSDKKLALNEIKLVGTEKLGNNSTQHLKLISSPGTVLQEWDLWIDQGDKPWLRRTFTRLKAPSGPELEISNEFSNWQENPKFASDAFAFVPPPGSTEIKVEEEAGSADPSSKLKGKAAPAIKLSTVDGGTFNLADSKGKEVVVLDFWATWCPPCRRALPILSEVTGAYASKGVRFCAIDLREDADKVKEFLKAQGIKANVAIDKDGSIAESYGVSGIPQSVIIGKDGLIKVVHVGFSPDLKEILPKELDAVLAGQEPKE